MHLVYIDESGNSGANLDDAAQPIFVLGALLVPEACWQAVEAELRSSLETFWPAQQEDFEVHATELVNPRTPLIRKCPPARRLAFIELWLDIAIRHGLRIIHRAIHKRQFQQWVRGRLGHGVQLHPQVAAFALLARAVDNHLASQPETPLGIFIFDENKQVARDLDKSIRILRREDSTLRLGRIIEKGFFIESHKSLLLQLCDICVYFLRREALVRSGAPARPMETSLKERLAALKAASNEQFEEVATWLELRQRKERPGA